MEKLVSRNAKCRAVGCQHSVPYYGCYPGLPQSRCCRCGIKLPSHFDFKNAPLYDEPTYPEGDGFYIFLENVVNFFNKVKGAFHVKA